MKNVLTCFLFLLLMPTLVLAQNGERGSGAKKIEEASIGVKRALVVGISKYNEESLQLNYAENDAALFREYLIKSENIPSENVIYLGDDDAVSINILRELKRLLQTVQSGDVVYIYFAGHGDVVEDFGEKEGFLLAADANAHQEYYAGGVIPLALLNEKVVGKMASKGAKIILILDACRSGFIFQEGTQKNMGTIQAMFENSTKILSCGANELSYESADINHGYFTYYLVQGLLGNADMNTDNNVQYRELDDYLYDNVFNTVSKKHKQSQTPIVKTQNDRLVLKPIDPNDKVIDFAFVKKDLKSNNAYVVRGITPKIKTPEVVDLVEKFNNAIDKQNYYGKPTSALELFKSASNNSSFSEGLLFKMQSELIKELSTSAQELINKYIDGTKTLPVGREFYRQAKHLEICLNLMGEDDFLYDRIYASKLLLESYVIVKNKNYSSYKIAKKKLKEALVIQPRAAYIHNALGLVYNYEEVYDSAHYHFKKAKDLINTWSNPVNNLGENLLDQYQYDEAKQYLDTSLGMDGSNVDAYIKLGLIDENQGKYASAETYYKKALEVNPNSTSALKKMSDLQKIKGNVRDSEQWYNRALEVDSLSTIIEFGLLNYINKNKIDDKGAEKLLLSAIDYASDFSTVYTQYADFLRINKTKLNRLKLADSLYSIAIKKDPHDEWSYAGKAWLNFDLRKPRNSKLLFEQGIKENANKPTAYYYYANYLKDAIKNYQAAEVFYKKATKKDKHYIPAYKNLVEMYNWQKKFNSSVLLLKNLIEENPNAPDYYDLLGNTYFLKGDYSEAIETFNNGIKLDSTYTKSYKNLGHSELHSNNFESAKKHYQMASNYDPNNNKSSDVAAYIISMAKNKIKFGTPLETMELFKLAYEIDNSVESGLSYAKYLYLNSKSNKAFDIGKALMEKVTDEKLEIKALELLVKSAIDENNSLNADAYFLLLVNKDKTPDLLLAAVYYRYKGDFNKGNVLISKTDPHLLRSTKLKELYSSNTIKNYIIGY